MRILVTGAYGFIGSRVAARALGLPGIGRVVVLDKLTYAANRRRLALHWNDDRLYECKEPLDVCDTKVVESVLHVCRPTHIIHCAAETHVDNSIANGIPFTHTNVTGTASLMEAVLRFHKRPRSHKREKLRERTLPRVLIVSTDEVYGPQSDWLPADEHYPMKPTSPYAASKAASELVAMSYMRTHGVPVLITRGCNTYGYGQHKEKLMPKVIDCIKTGKPIPIYGSGLQSRQWIYVEDHAESILAVALRGVAGRVVNIAGPDIVANRTLVKNICKHAALFSKKHRGCASLITSVRDRLGHDQRYEMINAEPIPGVDTSKFHRLNRMLPTVVNQYLSAP